MSVCVSFHELIKSSSKFHNIYKNTHAGACLIACNMQAAKMAVAVAADGAQRLQARRRREGRMT